MARITEITRCAGLNHYHFTMVPTVGGDPIRITLDQAELNITPSLDDKFVANRIALMIREAKAAGNTTFAQIRTYLINRDFIP